MSRYFDIHDVLADETVRAAARISAMRCSYSYTAAVHKRFLSYAPERSRATHAAAARQFSVWCGKSGTHVWWLINCSCWRPGTCLSFARLSDPCALRNTSRIVVHRLRRT